MPPLLLDDIAAATYYKLPADRQFGFDNWRCHLIKNKHDLTVIVNDNNEFRGMVIAYMLTDSKLFVNWCICAGREVFEQFLNTIAVKYPLARELVFDRRGKLKTYNIRKFLKAYGK
jgi:hypothetical protein